VRKCRLSVKGTGVVIFSVPTEVFFQLLNHTGLVTDKMISTEVSIKMLQNFLVLKNKEEND